MKIYLTTLFLCLQVFVWAGVPTISPLQYREDGKYITYTPQKNETVEQIAQRFSLPVQILMQFNHLSSQTVIPAYQTIQIPLTETNFFTQKGLQITSAGFSPIYAVNEKDQTVEDFCALHQIPIENFEKWNRAQNLTQLIQGEQFIVGWLRYQQNYTTISQTPTVVRQSVPAASIHTNKVELNDKKTDDVTATSQKANTYIQEIKKKDIPLDKITGTEEKSSLFKKKKINSIRETALENESDTVAPKKSLKEMVQGIFVTQEKKSAKKSTASVPQKQTNKQNQTPHKKSFLAAIFSGGGYKPYAQRTEKSTAPVNTKQLRVNKKPVITTTQQADVSKKETIQKNQFKKQSFLKKLFAGGGYEPYAQSEKVAGTNHAQIKTAPQKTNPIQRNTNVTTQQPEKKVNQIKEKHTPKNYISIGTNKIKSTYKKLFAHHDSKRQKIVAETKPVSTAKKVTTTTVTEPNKAKVQSDTLITRKEPNIFKQLFSKIKKGGYEPYAQKPTPSYTQQNRQTTSVPVKKLTTSPTTSQTSVVKKSETSTTKTKSSTEKTALPKQDKIKKNITDTTGTTRKIVAEKIKPITKESTTPAVKKAKEPQEKLPVSNQDNKKVSTTNNTGTPTNAENTTKKKGLLNRIAASFTNEPSTPNVTTPRNNIPANTTVKPTVKAPETKEEVEEILNDKPTSNTIQSESKSLNLSRSKNGKAAMFFSGPKGGKFYVVTNLAPKGSIVKVTNTSNGKSVMAEVISSLPNGDISKGLLIKMSDNARLPLGVVNSIFYVKVNFE